MDRLIELADREDLQRHWERSEDLGRQVMAIQERTYGPTHPEVAGTLNHIGRTLDERGKYADAEPLLRKALEIRRSLLGEQNPSTVASYNTVALNLNAQGKYADAEQLFRKALEINRAVMGEQDPRTATAYNNLAHNLEDQGKYDEAETLNRKALNIRRAVLGEQHPETANSFNNIAGDLVAQGKFHEAEPLLRRALEIDRAILGELNPETANNYNNLAADLAAMGKQGEAEWLSRRALDIRRAVLGEQHPITATSYNNVGFGLNAQGRYDEAEPLFRKALAIDRAVLGEEHPDTATSYSNVALNLHKQGKFEEAEPLYRKALEIRRAMLGERHPATGTIYTNLAFNLNAQGRYDEADLLFRKVLETDLATVGEQGPSLGASYTNLALNLYSRGKYEEAEPLFRKALEIDRAVLGDQHPDIATLDVSLAFDLNAKGEYGGALPFAQAGVEIIRQHRLNAAASSSATADGALAPATIIKGSKDPQSYVFRILMDTAWLRAAQAPGEAERLRGEAFTAAQDLDVSAAGLAMAQTAARAAAGGGGLGDLARRQQDLSASLVGLDHRNLAALGRGDAADAAKAKAELEAAAKELAEVNETLRARFPNYAELVSPKALELAQVQQRLGRHEGLLLIAPAGDDVFSFAVSKTKVSWNGLAGGAKTAGDRVDLLLCQVGPTTCGKADRGGSRAPGAGHAPAPDGGGRPFDRAAAYGLYHDLVAPVEGALSGVTQLYVTTSAPLSGLPLSVLITEPPNDGEDDADPETLKASSWFSDRYALTTLPTVSSLQALKSEPAGRPGPDRRQAFLGYGAPNLSGGAEPRVAGAAPVRYFHSAPDTGFSLADPDALRSELAPLPGTKVELQAMADTLKAPETSLHLGDADTERAVRADPALATARVIAFATHGLLPTDHIEGLQEPGLVFTPPQTASDLDDGVLTASEVSAMSFSADWIILSACNTAASDGTPGSDSLSSLARAFLYAGAHALLASHWRVSDQVTAALTVETLILTRDHPDMTKAEALQRAMRDIRTGERPDGSPIMGWTPAWAHPSAWAPFSLIANSGRSS